MLGGRLVILFVGSCTVLLVDPYLFSPLVEFILLNLFLEKKGPNTFVALRARHTGNQ
jgi:hypothetical protein